MAAERPFTPTGRMRFPGRVEIAKPRYVYFTQGEGGGLIKIGIAADPLVRLYNMQSGCPVRLVLLGCILGGRSEERKLHARFADERRHFEWFEPTDKLTAFIEGVLREHGVPREEYEADQGTYRPKTVIPFLRRENG